MAANVGLGAGMVGGDAITRQQAREQWQAENPNLLPEGGSAEDMSTYLLAAEFLDWESTYQPIELNLLGQSSLNNPEVLTGAIDRATGAVNQAYDTLGGVQDRQMAARGLVATGQQQEVADRLTGLSRAAAVAGAQNRARQQVATQDELIALGTAPNPNIIQQSRNSKGA